MAVAVDKDKAELYLSGTVGNLWFDDCFSSGDLIFALASIGSDKDITVRLNSSGGIASEGAAIHSILAQHKGNVVVQVEGIAASAASIIAMAGDEIVMMPGALMMVHEPSGITMGTAADHEMQLSCLNAMGDGMAGIYADRTGKTVKQARADMKAETWMNGAQAVDKGYATSVKSKAAPTDPEPEVTAFDFRLYHHAPKALTALAQTKGWAAKTPAEIAAVTAKAQAKELTDMALSDETKAEIAAAVTAAVTAALPKAPEPAKPGEPLAATLAADIVVACNEGGVPMMAADLIRKGSTIEEAKAAVAQVKQVNSIVANARKKDATISEDFGTKMLAAGKSVADIRASLFDAIAGTEEQTTIDPRHTPRPETVGGDGLPNEAEQAKLMKASMAAMVNKGGAAKA